MATRIFLSRPAPGDGVASLDAPTLHYLTHVLRMKAGDRFRGFDAMGAAYDLILEAHSNGELVARVIQRHPAAMTAAISITLAQSLPKGPKFDIILRQGTEMGVNAFLPFLSDRGISRPDEDGALHKRDRWEKLLIEACRQCGRADVPKLHHLSNWLEVLEGVPAHDLTLFLYEKEALPLKAALETKPQARTVMLIAGPEGGWTAEEAGDAMKAGAHPVHLPTPILRSETSGLAASAMVRFHYADR
jgi:16S rRNA (uracil1498-N3)-methyltransferase